ncbi:hypothetical protein [Kocuria sp.]|uniref:hypothetical protein n=1 Tax=Kocuria sp. TaxID=1871328 RepID=UPI0026DFB549|nr:hypothetical protein [Kocuria sp.]MDO5617836.1 hypothetical protein [Kocuria sp.]
MTGAISTSPAYSSPKAVSAVTAEVDGYSDVDFIHLLLDGTGPISRDHPEVLDRLGFAEERPTADPEALEILTQDFLAANPHFRQEIVGPLTSGNPARVELALVDFTTDFHQFYKDQYGIDLMNQREPLAAASGTVRTHVAVYTASVANVALYHTASVATLAVVVVTVVPGAITYLPDEKGEFADKSLEKKETVAELTRALAEV